MTRTNNLPFGKKKNANQHPDKIFIRPSKLTPQERAKREKFMRFLDQWAADDSGEQERSWAITEKMLKENALSKRNRSNG